MLLPDKPYQFTADDGPETFTQTPAELVSGRLLTWYGPSLLETHTWTLTRPGSCRTAAGIDLERMRACLVATRITFQG